MFESIGELVVVSVLLGVTVLAFVYLGYRGAHEKRTNKEPTEDSRGDLQHDSARLSEAAGAQDSSGTLTGQGRIPPARRVRSAH